MSASGKLGHRSHKQSRTSDQFPLLPTVAGIHCNIGCRASISQAGIVTFLLNLPNPAFFFGQLMLRSIVKSAMATEATARSFFASPQFAVVGASSDPTKFGHKSPSSHLLRRPFPSFTPVKLLCNILSRDADAVQ